MVNYCDIKFVDLLCIHQNLLAMKNLVRLSVLSILTLTLYFCQFSEKTDQTEKEAFSGYIQGHTAGVISGGDVIRIYLAQSLQDYNDGDELPESLLNFRPDIKGTLWYLGDGLIEFQPDERLENGNSYKAEFSLGKLIAIPNELKEFSFDFDVLPLDFTVHQGNVSISGKTDAITVSGRIRSSDYIEMNALESYFSLESAYESPKFSIEESGKNSYTYRILDIEQQDERYNIELIWNGRADRIDQKGSQEIVIPGNNDFDNTRTTKSTVLTRFLMVPHNVNYHLEHHLFTRCPWYNLPKAHSMMIENGYEDKMCLETSYKKVLLKAVSA